MKGKRKEIRQCGLCVRWTRDGDDLPSGNWNPQTGETPCDNFICWRCQREARGWQLLGKAAERFLSERKLSRAA